MLADKRSHSSPKTTGTTSAKAITLVLIATVALVALVTITQQQRNTGKVKPSQLYSQHVQTTQNASPRPAWNLIDANNDILNGALVTESTPWRIGLMGIMSREGSSGPYSVCSGFAVNDLWVVTASHCCLFPGGKRLLKGHLRWDDHTREYTGVADEKRYPGYRARTSTTVVENDLCLLKSDRPLGETRFELANGDPPPGTQLRIAGYGWSETVGVPRPADESKAGVAHEAVVTTKICLEEKWVNRSMKQATNWRPELAAQYHCVYGGKVSRSSRHLTGACGGDSGGPLFSMDPGPNGKWQVYGINAMAAGSRPNTECPTGPSYYTAISRPPFYDWVRSHIGSGKCREWLESGGGEVESERVFV